MTKLIPPNPYPLLVLFVLLLHGCAREIIIDLPKENPRIVAICHFNEKQPFRVKVTLSQPVYGSETPTSPEIVDVSLSYKGGFIDKLRRQFTDDGEIYWESRDTAVMGRKYNMAVSIPGYPTVEASSKVPFYEGLDTILLNPEGIKDIELIDGRRELRVPLDLSLAALPGDHRYFAFHLSHEIGVGDFSVQPPEIFYTITSDSTFFLADGGTLSLLHNVPEPVVLINANFWKEDRSTLHLIARVPYDPANDERPSRIFVEWRTLSEEFYRYQLSIARQGSSLPLSDPDAVYNNIEGGYGNFSGYSSHTYTVELPH